MTLITKPDFTYVWASGGAVVAPNDSKKQLGWVAEAPPFQYDNWLQNRQDQMLAHINQRGIPAWDGLTNYEAGGLSYVQGSDGKVYKSVAASGPATTVQDPTTDVTDTYWTIAFASTAPATETVQGIVELATTAEAQTGTDDIRAMTPLKVKQAIEQFASSSFPFGYFSGFTLANNSGAPNTTVDVGAGSARSSDNTVDVTLASTFRGILQATGAWAAGDNQNKLDTGARANNTWYHVFAIRKTSDGTGDTLFSLSATAPTMPVGYSGFRRISAIRTNGSGNIIAFLNAGDLFLWKAPPLDVNVGPGIINVAYAISVPTGVRVMARFGGALFAAEGFWSYRATDTDAIVPAYLGYVGGAGVSTTSQDNSAMECEVLTDTSAQAHFQTEFSAAPFKVVTYGWRELRS